MVERLGTPAVLVGIYKVANSPLVEYICNWACKLVSSIWKGRVRVANYQVRTCRHGWTFEAQILPRVTRPVPSRRLVAAPHKYGNERGATAFISARAILSVAAKVVAETRFSHKSNLQSKPLDCTRTVLYGAHVYCIVCTNMHCTYARSSQTKREFATRWSLQRTDSVDGDLLVIHLLPQASALGSPFSVCPVLGFGFLRFLLLFDLQSHTSLQFPLGIFKVKNSLFIMRIFLCLHYL